MSQLIKKILFKGEVLAETGLLIGGTNTAMAIGGPDKTVIRNPVTNEPYIPGSSLKGKMRSLLEISYGKVGGAMSNTVKHGPYLEPDSITTVLFGSAHKDADKQRPSRIIVRDGKLLNREELEKKPTDLPFTEAKTEVVIDRITSAAMPRTFERVPAGARFALNIVLNVFQDEQESELIGHVFKGLQMVQDDYLGGSGSRGSGQVKFKITEVLERSSEYYHSSQKIGQGKDITTECNIPTDLK